MKVKGNFDAQDEAGLRVGIEVGYQTAILGSPMSLLAATFSWRANHVLSRFCFRDCS
jgi:hypothetical protein